MISPYVTSRRVRRNKHEVMNIISYIGIKKDECRFLEADGLVIGYMPITENAFIRINNYKKQYEQYQRRVNKKK